MQIAALNKSYDLKPIKTIKHKLNTNKTNFPQR